jgi:hypothetical protein
LPRLPPDVLHDTSRGCDQWRQQNTTAAPVAGANSFAMGQAQKRIEDQGHTQVTALAKGENSVWRGHAMKDGKAVNVALDFQGNITAN